MAINRIDKKLVSRADDLDLKIGKKPIENKPVDSKPALEIKSEEDTSVALNIQENTESTAARKVAEPNPVEPVNREIAAPAQARVENTVEDTPSVPTLDLNEVLSNEQKQKIYNQINNSVTDPAEREQALKNTGIDFSFLNAESTKNKPENNINNDEGRLLNEADETTGNWLEKAIDNVEKWLGNAVEDVGNFFKTIFTPKKDGVESQDENRNPVGEWIRNAAEDVGEWLGNAAKDVGNFFKSLFGIKNEVSNGVNFENADGLHNWANDVLGGDVEQITDKGNHWLEKAWDNVNNFLFGKSVEDGGEGRTWLGRAIDNINNLLFGKSVEDGGYGRTWLGKTVDNVKDWLGNAAKDVGNFFKTIFTPKKEGVEGQDENRNPVGEWIRNAAQDVGEWLGNAWDNVNNFLFGKSVEDGGEGRTWLGRAIDNINNLLFGKSVEDGGDGRTWLGKTVDNVKDWLGNAAKDIGNFFKNLFGIKNDKDNGVNTTNEVINAENENGLHNWNLDELGEEEDVIVNGGELPEVVVTPEKNGVFWEDENGKRINGTLEDYEAWKNAHTIDGGMLPGVDVTPEKNGVFWEDENGVRHEGFIVIQKNNDGSTMRILLENVNGTPRVAKQTITDAEGSIIKKEFVYNEDGSKKAELTHKTDLAGNEYEYKKDPKTGKDVVTQVTNQAGQTFVIDNYKNNDGTYNWEKLQQDGWGTRLTGADAQEAWDDVLAVINGKKKIEELIERKPSTSNNSNSNNNNNTHHNSTTTTGYTPGAAGSGQVWRGNVDNYQGGSGYQNIDSYGNGQWVSHNDWTFAPGQSGGMSSMFNRPGGGGGGAHY